MNYEKPEQPKVEINKDKERVVEILHDTDALFILAHGHPPQDKLEIDARLRVLGAVEAEIINPNLSIVFVGGHVPEGQATTSQQMAEYFSARSDSQHVEVLDQSNNTVLNIEEIIAYLERHPEIQKISIMAARFQLERIEKILKNLNLKAELIPYDPLVVGRSNKHEEILEKYEKSLYYKRYQAENALMIAYMKFDPNQHLVTKYKDFQRKIKSKLKS